MRRAISTSARTASASASASRPRSASSCWRAARTVPHPIAPSAADPRRGHRAPRCSGDQGKRVGEGADVLRVLADASLSSLQALPARRSASCSATACWRRASSSKPASGEVSAGAPRVAQHARHASRARAAASASAGRSARSWARLASISTRRAASVRRSPCASSAARSCCSTASRSASSAVGAASPIRPRAVPQRRRCRARAVTRSRASPSARGPRGTPSRGRATRASRPRCPARCAGCHAACQSVCHAPRRRSRRPRQARRRIRRVGSSALARAGQLPPPRPTRACIVGSPSAIASACTGPGGTARAARRPRARRRGGSVQAASTCAQSRRAEPRGREPSRVGIAPVCSSLLVSTPTCRASVAAPGSRPSPPASAASRCRARALRSPQRGQSTGRAARRPHQDRLVPPSAAPAPATCLLGGRERASSVASPAPAAAAPPSRRARCGRRQSGRADCGELRLLPSNSRCRRLASSSRPPARRSAARVAGRAFTAVVGSVLRRAARRRVVAEPEPAPQRGAQTSSALRRAWLSTGCQLFARRRSMGQIPGRGLDLGPHDRSTVLTHREPRHVVRRDARRRPACPSPTRLRPRAAQRRLRSR